MERPTGKLELDFRRREDGKTYVARQYFKLPLQVMPPFYQDDDGTAFVYLLNPSGGILQHDRLMTEIRMEEGSRALITTPSNNKFYRMDEGHAKVVSRFTVKAGAVLEYLPEHNVPFAQSKTYQETDFYLDPGAVLIASDMVTAGRVSRGEQFQYDLYSARTRIYVDGKLKVYDNSRIEPGGMDMESVGMMEGYLTNGTIYAYAPGMSQEIPKKLRQLPRKEGICFSAGMIEEDLMIVRFLGDDIIALQETIFAVWGELRTSILGKPAVRIRKY
ncbi:urease accessory protein UreD [bacterium 210820-DFI.6.37]|nr:urease accessory protein UreD [bacterium 210820-DFI.6.37]